MGYENIIKEELAKEKNSVNIMYLNEIHIKWKKISKIFDSGDLKEIVVALNDFTKFLQNPKFRFDGKNGFNAFSNVFSNEKYIEKLIDVLVKNEIKDKTFANWGIQKFSYEIRFFPYNLTFFNENPECIIGESPEFLCLTRKFDFKYKQSNLKNYKNFSVSLPLLVFYIYDHFDFNKFLQAKNYAKLSKKTYQSVRNIVIAETIDKSFRASVNNSLDNIFILRKSNNKEKCEKISYELVLTLQDKIKNYLNKIYMKNILLENGFIGK